MIGRKTRLVSSYHQTVAEESSGIKYIRVIIWEKPAVIHGKLPAIVPTVNLFRLRVAVIQP